jgi:hypothetical protein
MNGVREPCAGEPHARFDRGPLAKLNPRRDGNHAPTAETHGTEPVRPNGHRPTSGLPHRLCALELVPIAVLSVVDADVASAALAMVSCCFGGNV